MLIGKLLPLNATTLMRGYKERLRDFYSAFQEETDLTLLGHSFNKK